MSSYSVRLLPAANTVAGSHEVMSPRPAGMEHQVSEHLLLQGAALSGAAGFPRADGRRGGWR